MNIVRGQKIKLSDATALLKFEAVVHIAAPKGTTVDISCFGLDEKEKLSDDRYFIFYNQKNSPCGSLVAAGPGRGGEEVFRIDLSHLPSNIRKLLFTATIDGIGDMSSIGPSWIKLFAAGDNVLTFSFGGSDFSLEKAVMIADIYLKDIWRFAANGQGFNGGLEPLLKHFGGEVTPSEPSPAPKVNLAKYDKVEKQVQKEAPHLVSLTKKLKVSLEKKKLMDITAKVALVLDASGSMSYQYSEGNVQRVIDRVLPIALMFDDDGELEVWAFADRAKSLPNVKLSNVSGYIDREQRSRWNIGYGNHEPCVMKEVVKAYQNSDIPAYVIFISDGGVGSSRAIEKIMIEASHYPIFWQFVGLGDANYGVLENFDQMQGRFVDNANFFALDDIASVSDEELYDRLLNEFPQWLVEARNKKIIK